MKVRSLTCILAALFALSINTASQTSAAEIERKFDLAASKHKRELGDLFQTRGVPEPLLSDVTAHSLIAILGADGGDEGFSRRGGDSTIYPEKTAILFYSYEQGSLQSWLLTSDGIKAYNSKPISVQDLSTAISDLRRSLGAEPIKLSQNRGAEIVSTKPSTAFFAERAAVLSAILLPRPIAGAMAGVRHLIVVPVFGIATVPFPALEPFRRGSMLVDTMSVTIASSLFDIGQRLDAVFSSGPPLIVGNPLLTREERKSAPSLPGAEREALEVAKLLRTTPLIGAQATKEAILSKARRAPMLYFATHGMADSDDPLVGGYLMFAGGKWTAKEIQSSYLSANLVVLSACQTGLGRVHDAGMIGLARAFQLAGVPRVVMSLWNVDDAATSELMQAFVRNLSATRTTPAEALRSAMIELKKKRPNPAEWASFVVFGTPR